jgi:hypothetical protein
MFWDSVIAGFGVLGHIKIWLGIFLLVAAQFGFLVITAIVFGRGESGGRMAAGCLFRAVGGPLFQGFIMSIFVGFYVPMMLGSNEVTASADVLSYLWPLTIAAFFAVVALVILSIVPILGSLITESPGIQNFLLGTVIFRFVVGAAMAEASKEQHPISSNVYPGLLATIGYLVIAGILVRLILYLGVLISAAAKKRTGSELTESILMALAPSLGVLGGLLPLFMYAQHVRLAAIAASGN